MRLLENNYQNLNSFKYNVPTHTFFYTPVLRVTTLQWGEQYLMGEYYARFVYNGIGTAVIPEQSFSIPGGYYLSLLEKNDNEFTEWLFATCLSLTRLADQFQEVYYHDVKNNSVTALDDFYPEYLNIFTPAIGIGYVLDYALDQFIKKQGIDPSSIEPAGASFISKEKLDLKNVFEIAEEHQRSQALEEHRLRYAWLYNNYTGEHEVPMKYFTDRRNEVFDLEPHKTRHVIGRPTNMLEWISYLIYIRDERKRVNNIANGLLDRYLKKECERLHLNYADAVMCTIDEFESLKNSGNGIPIRSERIFKFSTKGPIDISEQEWQTLAETDETMGSTLHGQIASKGIVKGRAKIILSEKDFSKMENGDILIASMTRPEYAPILQLSAAIVTDEGGITCHAAIISRELRKPCVIGTQSATKVYKDGDMVEVDANTGTIKLLNNL